MENLPQPLTNTTPSAGILLSTDCRRALRGNHLCCSSVQGYTALLSSGSACHIPVASVFRCPCPDRTSRTDPGETNGPMLCNEPFTFTIRGQCFTYRVPTAPPTLPVSEISRRAFRIQWPTASHRAAPSGHPGSRRPCHRRGNRRSDPCRDRDAAMQVGPHH